MNLQDRYPFDENPLGLNNLYCNIGDRYHYINSENIQVPQKIITKGKRYLIASSTPEGYEVIVHQVKFLDGYYNQGNFYLFVLDICTGRAYVFDLCLKCTENECTWGLFDIGDQDKIKDFMAIKAYCGKCNGTKQTPIANSTPSHCLDNDLLEFEF